MPSTPYAVSTSATPIASAKRSKRRAQPLASSSVRRGALYAEGKGKRENGNEDARTVDKILEKDVGGELETQESSPKARKSNSSSTPRSSGVDPSEGGSRKNSPAGKTTSPSKTKAPTGEDKGETDEVSGRRQSSSAPLRTGAGGQRHDANRHKPQESSIFSPALGPEHHDEKEPRDKAPSSTVGPGTAKADSGENAVGTDHASKLSEGSLNVTPKSGDSAAIVEGEEEGHRMRVTDESDAGEGKAGEAVINVEHKEIKEKEDFHEQHDNQENAQRDDDEEDEDEEEEFNPYCFIAHLPPYNTVKHHTPEAPALPEKRKTRHGKDLTLVLDLDETLVHCTVDPIVNPDHSFEVHFNGEEFQVYVRKRPHLDAFLEEVSELFEVVVFTASQRVYAERLLNMIDPQRKYVKYRLYRDACMALEGNYLKDLNVLGRDLSKVAIVDNSPYAYGFQIDNGIPIESWFDDTTDEELLHLLPLLKQLISQSELAGGDVRPFIRSIFKTHELVDKARNGCLNGSSRDAGSPPSPSAKAAAADAAALSVRGASSSAASTNAMAIAEGSE